MNLRRCGLLACALLWVIGSQTSWAFYNPSTGRWLSRDPSADLTVQPPPPSLLHLAYSDAESGEADEQDGNPVPHQLSAIRPAYRFVDNDPIAQVDSLGEDIYLQRGNGTWTANRWLHLGVCVDTWHCAADGWKKTGKACFSFAMTGFRGRIPSHRWLGWSEVNFGGPLEGEIYQQSYLTGKVVAQRAATMRQDLKWYLYMLTSRVGTADTYSLARHNCRRYSKYEYRDAPLHMGPP